MTTTVNDAAASAHILDCQTMGQSQRNQGRIFMMDHTGGWMGGWAGGQMVVWAALAVLVVVVVVIKSLTRKKK
jgi:hypothetical protein